MRQEHIRAKILRNLPQRLGDRVVADVAEAIRDGLLRREPEPLTDVPLHKRGFGVMDEDAP